MEIFKCHPHIIICLLDRKKIDANRDLNDGTCGNPYAIEAWNDYHNFINIAKNKINADYQKDFILICTDMDTRFNDWNLDIYFRKPNCNIPIQF